MRVFEGIEEGIVATQIESVDVGSKANQKEDNITETKETRDME